MTGLESWELLPFWMGTESLFKTSDCSRVQLSCKVPASHAWSLKFLSITKQNQHWRRETINKGEIALKLARRLCHLWTQGECSPIMRKWPLPHSISSPHPRTQNVRWCFFFFLMSSWYKIGSSWKRQPQLMNCLYQTGLLARLGGIFLMPIDVGEGTIPSWWCYPWTGDRGLYRKAGCEASSL